MKTRVYEIMERAAVGDRASRAFDLFIVTVIGLNVAMVILETVEAIDAVLGGFFAWFEGVSVAVFTVEYLLRLWSCTADPDYRGAVTGRIRFALTGFALIDLFAILPFYLHLFFTLDPILVGAMRLFRLFRLFKMGRYIRSIRVLGRVARQKRQELLLVVTVLGIVLVMVSSLMYFVEHDAQPEAFSSIPSAMWWGMVTLTTIGYGDVFPVTPLGKFFGILIAMMGIGMFALPAGILSSGFIDALSEEAQEEHDVQLVVRTYLSAINAGDVDEVMSLMTDDHVFIDSSGDRVVGEANLREAWTKYFGMFPDYAVQVREISVHRNLVLIAGTARGTFAPDGRIDASNSWSVPAAWEAHVANGKVSEWRAFADTGIVRDVIARNNT